MPGRGSVEHFGTGAPQRAKPIPCGLNLLPRSLHELVDIIFHHGVGELGNARLLEERQKIVGIDQLLQGVDEYSSQSLRSQGVQFQPERLAVDSAGPLDLVGHIPLRLICVLAKCLGVQLIRGDAKVLPAQPQVRPPLRQQSAH